MPRRTLDLQTIAEFLQTVAAAVLGGAWTGSCGGDGGVNPFGGAGGNGVMLVPVVVAGPVLSNGSLTGGEYPFGGAGGSDGGFGGRWGLKPLIGGSGGGGSCGGHSSL